MRSRDREFTAGVISGALFLVFIVGLTVWRLNELQTLLAEKEAMLAAPVVVVQHECTPVDNLLQPAFYEFLDGLHIGVVILELTDEGANPLDGLTYTYANPTSQALLPHNLAVSDLQGRHPRDIFPKMSTDEGEAFFGFVSQSVQAGTPIPVGVTTFNGLPWYSAIVPVDEAHAAIVFHPLDDPRLQDVSADYHFADGDIIDAQVAYIDALIEQVGDRVDRVEPDESKESE